jgi:hypothetical protein
MFVVPVKGDKIRTKDDGDPRTVSSFSSLKNEPAVYLLPSTSQDRYIYFSDIVEINGVRVEWDSTSKTFNALGPLKRKYNLPQPKDTITVKLTDAPFKKETEEIEVESLKLHNKREGITRGLLACSSKACYSLHEILDIKRRSWSETFNAKGFQKFYFDYLPYNLKSRE